MKVLTLAVLAFCTEGHKLSQHQQQGLRSHQKLRSHLHSQSHSMSHSASRSHLRSHAGVRYEDSEGPTKVDFGDGDEYMIDREADLNVHKEKSSGWTNPLSWEDDGMDDDSILNLGYDTSKLKDSKDAIQSDNTLDDDIKTTLDSEAQSQELVKKQRVKWAEMEMKNAAEDAQIESQEQAAKQAKQSKKGKGKKAPAAAEEEQENPKVAGEKEDNKKAAKNTVKQAKEAKTEKPEAAAKESGEEEKTPKAEPAAEKKEKAVADDKKKVAAEDKKEEVASAAQLNDEPQPVKHHSQAQVTIEDLSDNEINLIQKKMKDAEETDLLDQDLNSEPYDLF